MNFNGEKEVKEILNVIHGKMIIYNTAFKNSNFCALNDIQYLDIITLILSWTLYYLKVLTLVIWNHGLFPFKRLIFEMENDVHALFY